MERTWQADPGRRQTEAWHKAREARWHSEAGSAGSSAKGGQRRHRQVEKGKAGEVVWQAGGRQAGRQWGRQVEVVNHPDLWIPGSIVLLPSL